jgi:hypothetical protein
MKKAGDRTGKKQGIFDKKRASRYSERSIDPSGPF